MQSQDWTVPGAPVKGYVWHAADPRGNVLLTHGFGEYAARYVDRYHALIPTLVAAGFTVYAADQRGHGASGGARAVVDVRVLVEDHLAAREALRADPRPLFLLGHSMGGLVTAASAARDPRGISGVILSSPALLVGENEPALVKRLAPVIARLAPGLPTTDLGTGGLSRLPEEVAAYEADPRMYHGKVPALTGASMLALSASLWPLYARWTLPTLVVHGAADRLTDPRGSQRFMQAIASGDRDLLIEDGGYHELLNDEPRDRVRARIVDWLRAHTA
ncbi:alpha/beta hydrolase [Deinococcus aquaticus]|uniref:Lysophospholipase n=1 Tax=Deinococcus aquaticus TaxID=328692 RepID=A0ABY7V0C4_9DEIO|nr:alpha/beta hydrolase [Deinococcus aquaticus]WDA58617.1 lysophospholipase [Deinococcus aquaticus]